MYVWDLGEPELLALARSILGYRREQTGPLEILSAAYVMRVERRTRALTGLFRNAHYVDAANVVRSAFEDWVTYSYLQDRHSDFEVLDTLQFEHRRTRAKLFAAIEALTNRTVAIAEFGELPTGCFEEAKLPSRIPDLASRSRLLGLEEVYRALYPYLSMLSHGDLEALWEAMPYKDGAWTPESPVRDSANENRVAMWAWWFHLRTLTRCAFVLDGTDLEPYSDRVLALATATSNPHAQALAAVLRREIVRKG